MVDRFSSRNNTRATYLNAQGNGGCGCNGNGNRKSNNGSTGDRECKKLLRQLQIIDFSLIETMIYLDAYPNCQKALEYFNKLKGERTAIAEALAAQCNMPVTALDNTSSDNWDWISAPWPWEHDAN